MYPLKTSKNQGFSDIFQGYTNGSFAHSRGTQMDHRPKISYEDVSAYDKLTSF